MNRSKLQICTEILCKLASNGPMSLGNISEILDIKEAFLIKHLKLLQDSSLVIKENFGENKIFFTLTEKGIEVLQLFANIYSVQNIDVKTIAIPI
ncbi:MAG: winged helix-turn-helix domain-containing protein [Candidatus Bathyarchaeota archaeon]